MGWSDRIVGEATVEAASLEAHPLNWRQHPNRQAEALTELLDKIGWIQRVIVNQRTGRILDGHLRVRLAAEAGDSVPVLFVDLSEAEELKVLATYDPISQLAVADREALEENLSTLGLDDGALLQAIREALPDPASIPEPDRIPEDLEEEEAPESETSIRIGSIWVELDQRTFSTWWSEFSAGRSDEEIRAEIESRLGFVSEDWV